jgi:hypothetical protein
MKNTTLENKLYVSPVKERNIERDGEYADMCECCGKRIKEGETKMVHMNTNWMAMHNSIKTDEDALKYGFETQGYFYIGNTCAKKMPKEFIHA